MTFKPFGETQFFEDFAVGDRFRTAPVHFEEPMIVAFAKQYDPQGFHTDRDYAAKTIYGGIIASGWQVAALTFRTLIDAGFLRGGGMGSPGLDEMRWYKPVRPGDDIHLELTVASTRTSNTRADRGYVNLDVAALNQKGETVMSYKVMEILRRRG
ncbi:MAG: MaoC family dehydratase [Candidatus Eiseniibacteriota bacterium]